jgi:alcohol dehydrogenase (cytochrome c)
MVWYFQSSPHDTHDWDSTETAVLFDGRINGQPRKLLAQAARNGHFFVLDRTNGKALVSSQFVETNWSLGYDAKGQPIPNPAKFPKIDGVLVSPNQGGAANWQSPTFSPRPACFTSTRASLQRLLLMTQATTRWAGAAPIAAGMRSRCCRRDYQTGKIRWSHPWEAPSRSGLLSTAGNLIFSGGRAASKP